MSLVSVGWSPRWEARFESHRQRELEPARIARADRDLYHVHVERGLLRASLSGRLRHQAVTAADLPTVGDWVAARVGEEHAVIHELLPRVTLFSRKAAGLTTEEQLIAANVDVAFLVSGLDANFNPRRIERYLAAVYESGARPVIVLNKADACADAAGRVAEAQAVSGGVPVHAVSALGEPGLAPLLEYLEPGTTAVLLGSSGVGKSTIVNALLGAERQATAAVRTADQRGRHTTTARELIPLDRGAVLLDTPGMRELQLWGDEDAASAAFGDLEALARQCRFGDCRHDVEPGCAVRAAVETGVIREERLSSWRKLQRELEAFAVKHDVRARLERKAKWRSITRQLRKRPDKRR